MIDNGQMKNQADLACKLGISRVRICQILNLLKLDSLIVQELEKLSDPLRWLAPDPKRPFGIYRKAFPNTPNYHNHFS
ncbi:MAG: hypothetical protein MUO55_01615 [Candidatus Atribacteria bacterium]|nr:hypothetical protein [Candidatus Atribacteria bacterium]